PHARARAPVGRPDAAGVPPRRAGGGPRRARRGAGRGDRRRGARGGARRRRARRGVQPAQPQGHDADRPGAGGAPARRARRLGSRPMDVGIGLPATIPGVEGGQVLEWARRAEARGFSSLGTIDRVVYPNYEPLIALAAAAAVTERIRLATTILIAPVRVNGALLAKQAATIDHLSGGRLTFGVAVGGREDDYAVSGADFQRRGRHFEEMLEQWRRI